MQNRNWIEKQNEVTMVVFVDDKLFVPHIRFYLRDLVGSVSTNKHSYYLPSKSMKCEYNQSFRYTEEESVGVQLNFIS